MFRNAITQLSRGVRQPLSAVPKRTYFQNGPPKYPIKPYEWAFGMVFIACGAMAPAGYILSHLEAYRGKAEEE